MNKMTPIALLLTGGFAGQASATTQYFNVGPSLEGTAITIGDSLTPQYVYQTTFKPFTEGPAYEFQTNSPSSYLTTLNDASDVPTGSSSYYQGSYKVGPFGDQVGLRFNIGTQTFYGVARFDSTIADALVGTSLRGAPSLADDDPLGPRLAQIDYQLASVPEPESWALLIAGMGVAGAALRRSRRRSALATA